jgi:hypothetical protein
VKVAHLEFCVRLCYWQKGCVFDLGALSVDDNDCVLIFIALLLILGPYLRE